MTNELTSALAAYRFYRSELRSEAIKAKQGKSITASEWETLDHAFIIARNNLVEAAKKENIKDIDDVNEELIFDAKQRYRKEKIAAMTTLFSQILARVIFVGSFFLIAFLSKWLLKFDYLTSLVSIFLVYVVLFNSANGSKK